MADEDGDSEDVIRRNRFSGGPACGLMSSLVADERISEADLAAGQAHIVMLVSQDIIESEVANEILAALDEVEATGHDVLPGGEDVYGAIEAAVIDIVGPDGGKMHTARPRSDEVAICIRYCLHEDVFSAPDAVFALCESPLETAAVHTRTVMLGYTYLQPAQSTTAAHFLLSYEWAVIRDCVRLMCAHERINQSPLGSAASAGTPFDVNRELTADLLGFDRVMENSMDASVTCDSLMEMLPVLTIHAVTLSGLAADLMIFPNKRPVELPDDYSSTSSIMPQKKNPDTMELARAVAGDVIGEFTSLLTTLKGLPCAYNRGSQRAHKYAFRTVDDVGEVAAAVAGTVASVTWPEDELAAAAGDDFSTVIGVADLLAMTGSPPHMAHEVVAEVAVRSKGALDVATLDAVATNVLGESLFMHVTVEVVEAVLDLTESVASRDSVGGPAPVATETMLSTTRDRPSDDAVAVADVRDSLAAAARGLDEEISSYI